MCSNIHVDVDVEKTIKMGKKFSMKRISFKNKLKIYISWEYLMKETLLNQI